jgi:hypothetical protein
MKYRPITEMTDKEIEFLWKDIFQVNKITSIERNIEDNEIVVGFITTWGDGTKDDPYIDIEDSVIMYSDDFEEPNFPVSSEEKFKYRQYMIAKGYSKYWKDNPYIDSV